MTGNTKKTPSMAVSALTLFAVAGVIIMGIKLDFGTQMSVFCGAVVAIAASMLLGNSWSELQTNLIQQLNGATITNLILIEVGILIGIWLIGGALPTLIYYGLGVISPAAIVPLAFILCALVSVCTGTSYGSAATMGLALFGIGLNMGINPGLLAGAIISGAYFGDKMSPMSDTTNVASAVSGSNLYDHISSMLYTTIPATLICLVLYFLLGRNAATSIEVDLSSITQMRTTLAGNFNISVLSVIPMVLILVLSILKVPAILAMGITAVVSVFFAFFTQGVSISAIFGAAYNGFSCDTGLELVDTILNRGGAKSMLGTVYLIMFASVLASALHTSGVLMVVMDGFKKHVKSRGMLVLFTMLESYLVLILTGNQTMSLVIPGQTFKDTYEDMNVNARVLSRSLEDSGTLGCVLVPWSSASQYMASVLGIAAQMFIPFCFLAMIVPVFSLICAFTGFGIWDREGKPKWKKQ